MYIQNPDMVINTVVLIGLVLAALWTVMTRSLLRAAIGLAFTSAILTILMFRLGAPLAGVFELSVCAGLISVLFISTIGLTQSLTQTEVVQYTRKFIKRFWPLPLLVVAVFLVLNHFKITPSLPLPAPDIEQDVRAILWNFRPFDFLGQIFILIIGAFGIVVLFREAPKK